MRESVQDANFITATCGFAKFLTTLVLIKYLRSHNLCSPVDLPAGVPYFFRYDLYGREILLRRQAFLVYFPTSLSALGVADFSEEITTWDSPVIERDSVILVMTQLFMQCQGGWQSIDT
jgi:hypothetical protein